MKARAEANKMVREMSQGMQSSNSRYICSNNMNASVM